MSAQEEMVYVTALFYLKEDKREVFDKYTAKVNAVFSEQGGRLDKVIKPIQVAKGDILLPDEIHFASFSNQKSFEAIGAGTAYLELVRKYREPAVEKLIVIVSKNANSAVALEQGDKSKLYAVTILNYNEGEEHQKNFESYLSQSVAIMPEFGAHFEKFLVPTAVRGDMETPSKVHLFYFDSKEGMQQMLNDDRMKALFPIRDKAVRTASLILGVQK